MKTALKGRRARRARRASSADCFVLIIRPGKIHVTKGPFEAKNVCTVLRSASALFPDAVLSVCQVVHGGRLWATSEREWIEMMTSPNEKAK